MPESLNTTELIFWSCAITGSVFFAFKAIVTLLGGADLHVDGDHTIDAHDTEVAFKLFSITSITAFLMMFGWTGLAAYSQFSLNSGISILIAFIIGLLMMYLVTWLFQLALKLKSPGAVITEEELTGKVAQVYQKIPADGVGVVQVTVGGFIRELSAISEDQKEIASHTEVEVIKMLEDYSLIVRKKI